MTAPLAGRILARRVSLGTNDSREVRMARHMGIAFRVLGLAVVSCAVAAGAAEPAANHGAAGVPVRLVSAAPAKILYGLNEPVTGRVSVQNLAEQCQEPSPAEPEQRGRLPR